MYATAMTTLLIILLVPLHAMQTTVSKNYTNTQIAVENTTTEICFDLAAENENLKNRTIHPFMLYGTLNAQVSQYLYCNFCKTERGHDYIERNSNLLQELNLWVCKKKECAQALVREIKKRKREQSAISMDQSFYIQPKKCQTSPEQRKTPQLSSSKDTSPLILRLRNRTVRLN